MLPTKFQFIWPSSFRGEDLKKSANQKQELPVADAVISIQISELNYRYMPLKPLSQMN
jgi:hypothetical protein